MTFKATHRSSNRVESPASIRYQEVEDEEVMLPQDITFKESDRAENHDQKPEGPAVLAKILNQKEETLFKTERKSDENTT